MEVDINSIQPNSYNPKVTEDYQDKYKAIVEGIKVHGMKSPIDVREINDKGGVKYEIIDGYHRWTACKELGWTVIPISSWGKLDEKTAKKITILKEKAHIPLDIIKTGEILKELATETELSELVKEIGYSMPDIKADLDLANFSWEDYGKGEEFAEGVRTLSIAMSEGQYKVVMEAIEKAKTKGETDSNARALELVCADFLAGN